MLPTDSKSRKEHPIVRGVLDYFPDAIAAVANVSYVGNEQHNPGQEMHWAREKSKDHADCLVRHLIERGTLDSDGLRHAAKVAWRALALLQLEIEADKETPLDNSDSCDILKSLREAGCPKDIARLIRAGVSQPNVSNHTSTLYLAGPMRGYLANNAPTFDSARDMLIKKGWRVISPVDIDRAADDLTAENQDTAKAARRYAFRDFHALHWLKAEEGDAIAMLPGWENSTGATAEFYLAGWLGLKVLDATTGGPLDSITHSMISVARRHLGWKVEL